MWIGTSGWSYDHWDHVLYPPGTPPAKRLDLYMREFDTVVFSAPLNTVQGPVKTQFGYHLIEVTRRTG